LLAKDFPLGPCWLRDQDGSHLGSSNSSPAPSDAESYVGSEDDASNPGDMSDDDGEDDVASHTEPSTEGEEEDDPTFRRRIYSEVGSDGQEWRIWRRSPEWIVRLCSDLSCSLVLSLEHSHRLFGTKACLRNKRMQHQPWS
jgi:hypothetical protein